MFESVNSFSIHTEAFQSGNRHFPHFAGLWHFRRGVGASARWNHKCYVTIDMANFCKQERHSNHQSGKTHSQYRVGLIERCSHLWTNEWPRCSSDSCRDLQSTQPSSAPRCFWWFLGNSFFEWKRPSTNFRFWAQPECCKAWQLPDYRGSNCSHLVMKKLPGCEQVHLTPILCLVPGLEHDVAYC